MNKPNFDSLMTEQISRITQAGGGKLLLHCCCAPCSSACLERLAGSFEISALFYNPNIEDGEYLKRKAELVRFLRETGYAGIIDCDRGTDKFREAVRGLEREKEGGARCAVCFKLRLEKTAQIANELGFGYFTTTLTLSPLKDAALINGIGESLQTGGAKWLYSDFKKRGGYLRSIELSNEHGLYRQNFCGCAYSRIVEK